MVGIEIVIAGVLTAQVIAPSSRMEIVVDGSASVTASAAAGHLHLGGATLDPAGFDALVLRIIEETGVERAPRDGLYVAFGELFGVARRGEADAPQPRLVNVVLAGSPQAIAAAQAMFETDAPEGVHATASFQPADPAAVGDQAIAAALRNAEARARRAASGLGCEPSELQGLEIRNVSAAQSAAAPDEDDPWSVLAGPGAADGTSAQVSAQVKARFIADCSED